MQAGFACLEAGCVQPKNGTNILMKNILDLCEYPCIENILHFIHQEVYNLKTSEKRDLIITI